MCYEICIKDYFNSFAHELLQRKGNVRAAEKLGEGIPYSHSIVIIVNYLSIFAFVPGRAKDGKKGTTAVQTTNGKIPWRYSRPSVATLKKNENRIVILSFLISFD